MFSSMIPNNLSVFVLVCILTTVSISRQFCRKDADCPEPEQDCFMGKCFHYETVTENPNVCRDVCNKNSTCPTKMPVCKKVGMQMCCAELNAV
ncbi:hypothetical protein DdX_15042 [Ditylenchus destructor]|uniref:Uncharacterized protein n=1 Tax=Ditylenchus destructor TaxID=166010 RepID=A0AAD4MT96_9BILA|nr:hypothetical protein DdX_15042 [Ditylenchus destructor]